MANKEIKTKSDNLEIEEFARSHFNEPVLHIFDVVRLVGYGEDDYDCYYIVKRPNPHSDLIWISCVGGVILLDKLKDQNHTRSSGGEEWNDFIRLDNWLALNGAAKEDDFLLMFEVDSKE